MIQLVATSGACHTTAVLFFLITWLVVWNMFYFPFHIWDVILPIDELHHFSRWLLHHQPFNQLLIFAISDMRNIGPSGESNCFSRLL